MANRAILATGIVVLVAGVVVGVIRHNRSTDRQAKQHAAERAEYRAAIAAAAQRVPRLDVSYVGLTPSQFRRLTAPGPNQFRVVPTELAQTASIRRNVTALLFSQQTPGAVRLRLAVKRVRTPVRWGIADPTDVTFYGTHSSRGRAVSVSWTSTGAHPNAVVVLQVDGNRVLLSPRRLFALRSGRSVTVPIADALANPVIFLTSG